MPLAEQIHWYERFKEAQRRLNAPPVEATGTMVNGTEPRNDDEVAE
jgi:hypothetical protein